MPRKPRNDAPPGGWDCPDAPDLSRQPIRYAAGSKMVTGKLEWVWKPVDAKYLKWCDEQKAKANGVLPPIRQRTRKA